MHIKTAHGLRIDHKDNIWVTDIGNHQVLKYAPDGKLLLALGQKGQPGRGRTISIGPPTSRSLPAARYTSRMVTATRA